MGMDVYGKAPTSKEGEYFRNNVWWWRPLAELCCALAPEICAKCEHWQSNDGDGLDADDAAQLGALLEARIRSGDIAAYCKQREAMLAALPDEECTLCGGSGVRGDAIGREQGMHTQTITKPEGHPRLGRQGWCNGCDGTGKVRPFITHYPCDVENVAEFARFCKASGGFEIC